MFISFEGPDGTGKSTIMNDVAEGLKDSITKKIVTTLEPGATKFGSQIRNKLLNSDMDISERAKNLMFTIDRADHYERVLKPNLEDDKIVMTDRYWESTIAYQEAYNEGWDEEEYQSMLHLSSEGLKPDITFVFLADKPHSKGEDNFDKKSNEDYQVINEEYKNLKDLNIIDYPIYYIDTTEGNWQRYRAEVFRTIINYLHNKAAGGVNYA